MQMLPKWVLPPTMPAVYDSESFTSLEMVAKVYGAMNGLIEEYNKFADQVNTEITAHVESETKNREEFEANVTKVMNQFICSMEAYLKTNLSDTAREYIDQLIAAGVFRVELLYDAATEALTLDIVNGGVNNG